MIAGISQVEAAKSAVEAGQKALDATRAGFGVGTKTILDVLTAIQTLTSSESQYSQARHQFILDKLLLKQATGTAERETALDLVDRHRPSKRRITVGGDKGFDVESFVHALREREVTPHIAIDGHLSKTGKRRKTAVDGRILRHPGYAISQCCRKRIEEVFGWIKTTGGLAQLKVRGLAKVQAVFTFAILAYNLVRIPKLLEAT